MSVVVSGMGIVSALGIGAEANLSALRRGESGIGPIRNFATSHNLASGDLTLSDNELKRLLEIAENQTVSRTTLLAMLAAEEALQSAEIGDRSRVALVTATSVAGMDLTPRFYAEFMKNPAAGRLRFVAQHDCASTTERIKKHCGLGGYATAISTACSSAANAMIMAARLIESGLADTVVAGGADALSLYTLNGFRSLMILSSEPCKPFCETRNGLNLGEGAAFVVLQRSAEAKHAKARLAGYANANDAFHQTALTAEGRGPELAMRQALAKAGLAPDDISYINLHGTATPNNDSAESSAISRIWGDKIPPFSSTKPFTGHTLAAAGAIEAVFSVMSIENGEIWPNLNFTQPMQSFGHEPVTQLQKADVRNVISNSFGFGGNCSSLIFSKP